MTITSLNVVDGTIGRKKLPGLKKRYLIIGFILVIIVILVVLFATNVIKTGSSDSNEEILVPANPTKKLPLSASKLHIFNNGAVCSDAIPCSEIGKGILKKNGSAVDAALATMFCNGVYTMQSMGLGGGFLMTIYNKAENKAYSLNARETAPINAKPELYKDDENKSKNGPLSIAVPGELIGYWEAHKKFGKLSWKEVVEPTVEFCYKGYNMSNHQSNSLNLNAIIKDDVNIKDWLINEDGSFKQPGTHVIPKKLCDTLRTIADTDGYALHNGSLSKIFLEDLMEAGSILTEEDLLNYKPEWQTPISVKLRDQYSLYSAPPPGSGTLLAFIINILNGYNFTKQDMEGTDNIVLTYHRILETFKFAYAKRTEFGDMNFVNVTELISNLTSPEYASMIRKQISDNSTSDDPKHYGAVFYNKEDHGTAHISVMAPNGDAVSVTSSLNIYFGSGITSKRTGIILNSVMDDFSFPYFKNYFGLPGSPSNEMKPGKRPLSSMTPTIMVDKNGDVKLVVGASGGTRITTAVAQVILRTLWFGENLKEAVDAARIHHQLYPKNADYEYGVLQWTRNFEQNNLVFLV
ncbi:unnamed protein product [Brassicogethes aeneus]|uniref:Uncharacterized protein n=1 Tax=Brassicogethes aeneus TaxID=1431903 RepID=A0A9P0BHR3_BRAAE|nr:unnamed protein product [Brassicogethes aeneus]